MSYSQQRVSPSPLDAGSEREFWRRPVVQAIVPWLTSLAVHLGVLLLAVMLLSSGAFDYVIQKVIERINPPMLITAIDGERIVRPSPFDVHEVEEPRAVTVLLQHVDCERIIACDRDVAGHGRTSARTSPPGVRPRRTRGKTSLTSVAAL